MRLNYVRGIMLETGQEKYSIRQITVWKRQFLSIEFLPAGEMTYKYAGISKIFPTPRKGLYNLLRMRLRCPSHGLERDLNGTEQSLSRDTQRPSICERMDAK